MCVFFFPFGRVAVLHARLFSPFPMQHGQVCQYMYQSWPDIFSPCTVCAVLAFAVLSPSSRSHQISAIMTTGNSTICARFFSVSQEVAVWQQMIDHLPGKCRWEYSRVCGRTTAQSRLQLLRVQDLVAPWFEPRLVCWHRSLVCYLFFCPFIFNVDFVLHYYGDPVL